MNGPEFSPQDHPDIIRTMLGKIQNIDTGLYRQELIKEIHKYNNVDSVYSHIYTALFKSLNATAEFSITPPLARIPESVTRHNIWVNPDYYNQKNNTGLELSNLYYGLGILYGMIYEYHLPKDTKPKLGTFYIGIFNT